MRCRHIQVWSVARKTVKPPSPFSCCSRALQLRTWSSSADFAQLIWNCRCFWPQQMVLWLLSPMSRMNFATLKVYFSIILSYLYKNSRKHSKYNSFGQNTLLLNCTKVCLKLLYIPNPFKDKFQNYNLKQQNLLQNKYFSIKWVLMMYQKMIYPTHFVFQTTTPRILHKPY